MSTKPASVGRSTARALPSQTPARRTSKKPRPQAVRSADTRRRLVDAAVACLSRYGYSATTVSVVARQAKVSRGAMTHQYPAKSDLMVAVVEAVYEADGEQYRRSVEAIPSREWMRELPTIMWDVISRPSGIAVMEIMLASRSDRELADKLRSVQRGIDVHAHQWVIERLESAGLKDRPDGDAVHRLFVAAIRGLALEGLFRRDKVGIEKSVAVLKEIICHLYPGIGFPEKP
ncbi:TetR/AcrR family transcriptional regulator [Solimonas terrae]|uniref:TetR/AcrR family transcriptional regulator n=1 Tax=Solimonas terrae TaxID=1396819 RepID=A0A6M2BUC7_9GAMM|nr:TetR/AcrR family transcriptional regulator [Solimonas terrae]NGY05855.1 TetR/AcrR family transcriptional regulator [Solimonas terrae]